jgi:hypothetical protein
VLLATIAGGVYLVSSGTPQEATRESATQIATREPTSTPVSVAISISTPSPSSTVAPPLRASDTELPPTLAPTSSPTASRTPTAARSSTASSTPTSTPVRATPRPGVVTDFETFGTWQRGDEPNGTLTQSATQSYQGTYSGRLEYNFATRENDYVVFEQVHPIPGEPAQISAWVYGDGSGHFVNLWVKDSKGQTWQVPLGRVTHTGWQQMAGSLDVNQPWPWGHISGPDNGTIDYPVSFQAIVLDDNPDSYTGRGTLYVDEIRSSDQPTLAAAASATPSASGTVISQPYTPSPATTGLSGRIAFAAYNAGIGNYTLYTVRPDGSELNAVADYAYQPNVSPNGERIVVNCVGGGLDDLWSLKVDGTDWRHTTTHTDDRFPSWSPNSLVIGYSSSRQGDGVFRLYTRDAPVTTDVTSYVIGDYPIWADTWEIVYNGCDYGWSSGANCGLWRVISGRRPAQLTSNPADMPTDANGEEVLFLRPEGSDWNIFRMPLTGGNAVPLAGSPGNDGPASFSPNGQYVAFLSARSGTWALYTMSRAGGDVRKVIDLPHAGDYGAAPHDWTHQRISWGPLPAQPTPVPTSDNDGLLPAPRITFPIMDDTVSSTKATLVTWSWTQQLASNQGFEVRAWHTSQSTPMGVAPPTTQLQLEVHLGLTNAYLQFGEGTYYLDVVAVQISPYQILSGSAPIRVKTDPNK